MTLNLEDFQKQDIKFDIEKLQESYKKIVPEICTWEIEDNKLGKR